MDPIPSPQIRVLRLFLEIQNADGTLLFFDPRPKMAVAR